mmetsp:Transcript_4603/g.10892  ORF Transcript_4603/g.10892 Transcript_4603/m.10892 type:complete len:603 (-) Transcript_4603:50-1858(-)
MTSKSLTSLPRRRLQQRGLLQRPYCHDEADVTRYLGKKRPLSSSTASTLSYHDIAFHCGDEQTNSFSFRKRNYSSSSYTSNSSKQSNFETDKNDEALVHFPGTTRLSYHPHDENDENGQGAETSAQSFELILKDFAISKPKRKGGGHLLLGRNGSGKSLLVDFLTNPNKYGASLPFSEDGMTTSQNHTASSYDIAAVSFDSHKELLRDHPNSSVYRILTEDGFGGTLSKAAQFLVVRFGLFPLLYRRVSTLSTGEIRKCLIIRALCDGGTNTKGDLTKQRFRSRHKDPKLLILENAFDGLDADSRQELQSIVSKTMRGLDQSAKLLIQQVRADSVRPIEVFMSTHRPEEVMDEISTISMAISDSEDDEHQEEATYNHKCRVVTFERPQNMTREKLFRTALELDELNSHPINDSETIQHADNELALPSLEEIRGVWQGDNGTQDTVPDVLLWLDQVQIQRPRDEVSEDGPPESQDKVSQFDNLVTLLHELSWKIEKGQRWIIAGGNGAGKSTLTRFLLQGSGFGSERDDQDTISGEFHIDPATKVGWMSTESHLQMVVEQDEKQGKNNNIGVWDILCDNGRIPENVANTLASLDASKTSFCSP